MGVVPGACPSYSAPKVDVPRKKDLGGSCRREVIYICFPASFPDLFLLLLQRVYPCGSAASQVQTDYRWLSKGYYFHPTLRCNISVYRDQKHWWATAWLELWLIDFLREKKKKVVQVNPDWMFKNVFFTKAKKGKEVIWGHTNKMLQEDKLRWLHVWVEGRKLWHCFQSENWKCFEICWLWFWFNDRQNLWGIAFFERTWCWFTGSLWTSENMGLGWYQVVWNRQCSLVLQRTAAHPKAAPRASGGWGHWS